ncbi:MAG: zinc ABC transporter substrate-binding protein [Bacteriovoracaceae bacterium]|nr:zinc ABC transporter substrate-binding protein [Bacteriovoracaceae bacterium]
MKKLIFLIIFLFNNTTHARLRVITSMEQIASVINEIGGDKVALELIERDKLKSSDKIYRSELISNLDSTNLLVINGFSGEESLLPALVGASKNSDIQEGKSRNLNLGTFIKSVKNESIVFKDGKTISTSTENNPFYLLDPQNVIDISDIIANKLSQLDFKNRSHYLARSQLFKDQLSARMVSWTRRLNKVPNKKIFTSNNSYNYFLYRFGFESIEISENSETSQNKLSETISLIIDSGNIQTMLVKSLPLNNHLLETVLKSKSIHIKTVDLTKNENATILSYFGVLESLVRAIEKQ